MRKVSETFGSMVFDESVMKERLPKETFRQLLEANAADRIVAAAADHMDIRIAEDEIPGFNRRLMENQVDIYGLSPVGTTLEETFIEITGGGNIIG